MTATFTDEQQPAAPPAPVLRRLHVVQPPDCPNCPFSSNGQAASPVLGETVDDPKWIAVGEGPGNVEVAVGRPFVGPSGQLLTRAIMEIGGRRDEIAITNVTLCKPTANASDGAKRQAALCCAPRLRAELAQFPGRPILALGSVAAQQLLGETFSITQLAGSVFAVDVDGTGTRDVIPTVHPAAILRGGGDSQGGAGGGGAHVVDLLYWNLQYDVAKADRLGKGVDLRFSENIATEWQDPDRAHQLVVDIGAEIWASKFMACDTETYVAEARKGWSALQPLHAKLSAIGLATRERAVSVAWVTPDKQPFLQDRTKAVIADLLGDPDIRKVFHNSIYDRAVLDAHDMPVIGHFDDTLLMHHNAFPGLSHNLQRVGTQFYVIRPWKAEYRVERAKKGHGKSKASDWDVDLDTIEGHLRYNAKDTLVTAWLDKPLQTCLDRAKGRKTYEIDLFCARVAERMGRVGVPLDLTINRQLHARFAADLAKAEATLLARANDPAIREKLFDQLAYEQAKTRRKNDPDDFLLRHAMRLQALKDADAPPPAPPPGSKRKPKKHRPFVFQVSNNNHLVAYLKARGVRLYMETAKGRVSTKKDVLETLSHVPEVKAILDYREAQKQLSTFVDKYYYAVYPDGRIRPRWSVHKITGRWGAEDPQAMNVPKSNKKKNRPNLRAQVVAPAGRVFIGFDFAQLEARIIALLSGDPFLVAIFRDDKDIHSEFARVVWPKFDTLPPEQRKELRDMVKRPEYCVAPGTRVLRHDLTWVPVETLRPGDAIVGFTAAAPGAPWCENYFAPSRVVATRTITQPCYRITTTEGTVVASDEHLWVGRPRVRSGTSKHSHDSKRWCRTDELQPGDILTFTTRPWTTDESHGAGYLAGVFDGEGWRNRKGVGFAQNPGVVLDMTDMLMCARNFELLRTAPRVGEIITRTELGGGIWECLRFLGSIRPVRLLAGAEAIWAGRRLRGRGAGATVLSVEPLGEQPVVALQTTTETFIAEGFLSHNCAFYAGSVETGWKSVVKDYPQVKLVDIAKMVAIMKEKMPRVTQWQNRCVAAITTEREVRSFLYGRRRAFPLGNGSPNEAINFGVQSAAADIMATGLMRCLPRLAEFQDAEMILQIHDACVFEVREEDAQAVYNVVKESFTQEHTYKGTTVAFPVDVKIGKSWADV
jgi:DNA polymerase